MREVPLSGARAQGRCARVDDGDYDLVSPYTWYAAAIGRGRVITTYARAIVGPWNDHRTLDMHRLITGWPMTDHRDHDGLNNERYNLRKANVTLNNRNRRGAANSTSAYVGVCLDRERGLWLAYIRLDGRYRNIGRFPTELAAAAARDEVALAAWGNDAYINLKGH
jgi:AP2 domain